MEVALRAVVAVVGLEGMSRLPSEIVARYNAARSHLGRTSTSPCGSGSALRREGREGLPSFTVPAVSYGHPRRAVLVGAALEKVQLSGPDRGCHRAAQSGPAGSARTARPAVTAFGGWRADPDGAVDVGQPWGTA